MSMNDPLANALSMMKQADRIGKREIIISPVSNLIKSVMALLKTKNYISDFKFTADKRGGTIKVTLKGKINNIGVIKPRFSVKISDFEKFEKRYLPARNFGRLILSTPNGIMTQKSAEDKKIGGMLLAYVY